MLEADSDEQRIGGGGNGSEEGDCAKANDPRLSGVQLVEVDEKDSELGADGQLVDEYQCQHDYRHA